MSGASNLARHCPPLRRVERTSAPTTLPFDEFLRSTPTPAANDVTLLPAPLWQVFERENLQRPHQVTIKGRMIDVLA